MPTKVEPKAEMYCSQCREYVKLPHRCVHNGAHGRWVVAFISYDLGKEDGK